MQREFLKSKIHRATVTDSNINYEGSVTIDEELMEATGILPGEKVLIVNLNNGSRIESYAMAGRRGSGTICLNGGAARHGKKGDLVIIMCFCLLDEEEIETFQPLLVRVDEKNRIIPISSRTT